THCSSSAPGCSACRLWSCASSLRARSGNRCKARRSHDKGSPHLAESLRLIREVGATSAGIIDVGGGASTLVDDLIAAGVTRVTVLDISESAMSIMRARLGARAASITWLHADITSVTPGSYL